MSKSKKITIKEIEGKNEYLELLNFYSEEYGDFYIINHPKFDNEAVAILPFYQDKKDMQTYYYLINEPKPAWSNLHMPIRNELCSITGGMDVEGELPSDCAIRELKEEAGILCKKEDIISLGSCHTSKNSRMIMRLYAINMASPTVALIERTTDGSQFEKNSQIKVIDETTVTLACMDPLVHIMMNRLRHNIRYVAYKND